VLITTSRRFAERVAAEVDRQMPTTGPARQSIERHGGIIVCPSLAEAIARANDAAAEHVVAGDYAIGSNHVLPTAGAARYRGGLNAADFVKLVSVQQVTKQGLGKIGRTITALARTEGLEQHARSIEVRVPVAGSRSPRVSR
jgi:histidinol dehydrogenase